MLALSQALARYFRRRAGPLRLCLLRQLQKRLLLAFRSLTCDLVLRPLDLLVIILQIVLHGRPLRVLMRQDLLRLHQHFEPGPLFILRGVLGSIEITPALVLDRLVNRLRLLPHLILELLLGVDVSVLQDALHQQRVVWVSARSRPQGVISQYVLGCLQDPGLMMRAISCALRHFLMVVSLE